MKQYSRNEGLTILRCSLENDRKRLTAKRRESRHVQSSRIDLAVTFRPSSLRFPSHPVAAQEMKVKAKIVERSMAEHSRRDTSSLETKIPGNHVPTEDLLGRLERENRNRPRSCSLKSTRHHIRAKDRWSSLIDILKLSQRFYFHPCFSIGFSIFSHFDILFYFVVSLLKNYDYVFQYRIFYFLFVSFDWICDISEYDLYHFFFFRIISIIRYTCYSESSFLFILSFSKYFRIPISFDQ